MNQGARYATLIVLLSLTVNSAFAHSVVSNREAVPTSTAESTDKPVTSTRQASPELISALRVAMNQSGLGDTLIALMIIDPNRLDQNSNARLIHQYVMSYMLFNYLNKEIVPAMSANPALNVEAVKRGTATLSSPSGRLWQKILLEAARKKTTAEALIRSSSYQNPEVLIEVGKDADVVLLMQLGISTLQAVAGTKSPVDIFAAALADCNNRLSIDINNNALKAQTFPNTSSVLDFVRAGGFNNALGKGMNSAAAKLDNTDPSMREYMSQFMQFTELTLQSGLVEQRIAYAIKRSSPMHFDAVNQFSQTPYGSKVIQRLLARKTEDISTPAARLIYLADLNLSSSDMQKTERFIQQTWNAGFERDLIFTAQNFTSIFYESMKSLSQYCGT